MTSVETFDILNKRFAREQILQRVLLICFAFASVAQLVEQGTENPRVGGSIPPRGTMYADVAHLVERHLAKVEVASSSLVIRSRLRTSQLWLVLLLCQELDASTGAKGG